MTGPFATPAWLLEGIGSTPGLLRLDQGRLAFLSRKGTEFDEPLDAVTGITFPWYYFSGGFKATVAGKRRRISVTRPNDAAMPDQGLLGLVDVSAAAGLFGDAGGVVGEGAFALGSAARSLGDVATGRRFGKAWKALLTAGTEGGRDVS